jgi:hypothetical protein
MDLFERIKFRILGHGIFIEREKVIDSLGNERMFIRYIEEKIIIVPLDDGSIFLISQNRISFG